MKKIVVLILLMGCLMHTACHSVELEYYVNTSVPTFTCVTEVNASTKEYLSSAGSYVYVYYCEEGKQDKYIDKYIDYLKTEHNFAVVESDDSYQMITLAKEGAGVIISKVDSQKIHILPYKRSA